MKKKERPKGRGTELRPTKARVREALFDILRPRVEDAIFLDLYAGTGAVGINALKEGAASAMFVEESRHSAKDIFELLQKTKLIDRAEVMQKQALTFIKWAELDGSSFDIIFLDPPYHNDEINLILPALAESPLLNRDGVIIAEHSSKIQLPESIHSLEKIKDYHYGDSVLSFYRQD
ncbi:MAG: 16S rRNA (guanine(966)-N(2))-methyltransferase RsmD [Nitrospira sp.]|nr:16S rRNA (guanine(966)-N(2))-methyltransferase RsmD [bacterium]MBL7049471.1 16S rRNA (guanine(966)-N(2))-methyltransferase RsmD [Nitrospira sp.]